MSTMMMKPSELRKLMGDMGWSTARLAAELDLTEDTVRKWLRDERSPTGPALILLRQLQHNVRQGVVGLHASSRLGVREKLADAETAASVF